MGTSGEPSVHVSSSDQFGSPGGLCFSVLFDLILKFNIRSSVQIVR